jgi:predicted nucleic acid-binding protein
MRLLDTNIFVDHLRDHPPAVAFLEALRDADDVAFSCLTEAELLAGRANADPARRGALLRFLQRWTKIEVSNPIAELAGDLCRTCGLAVPDAIVAATALRHGASLITRNVSDFRRVRGLKVRSPY